MVDKDLAFLFLNYDKHGFRQDFLWESQVKYWVLKSKLDPLMS